MENVKFDVKHQKIRLHFEESECYCEKTGVCSVQERIVWIPGESPEPTYRNEEFYCPYILYKIEHEGFIVKSYSDRIILGHDPVSDVYDVDEGRHRTCIALKTDISITVDIYEKS